MKKIITFIASVIMMLALFVQGGFAASRVVAADDSAQYIKGARFLTALHGQAEDDSEIVIALYETKNGDVAYLNYGSGHVYTDYTVQDANINGIGSVQRYTLSGTFVVNFFMLDDMPCLITGDGVIYACEYLDSNTVRELMKLD